MRAGDLRHRITLQEYTVSQDIEGVVMETWVDVVTIWARVKELTGREKLGGDQKITEVSIEILMRYRNGIDTAMRVRYGTRIFDIQNALSDERKTELQLLCKEVI